MNLEKKRVLVTGGSRGLGEGLVDVLVERGAELLVVSRGPGDLARLHARLGVATIAADITDPAAAMRIVGDFQPDVLVLNAGKTPPMAPIDRISWEDFTATWNTDVRGGLYWVQAALNLPLAPGSRVLLGSSGAVNGSPMSGGYGGAKRMLWLMAKYANGISTRKGLDIKFQAIVPQQIIGGTGVGDAASQAYAAAQGMSREAFLAGFGAPLPPRLFGEHVAEILTDPQYRAAVALGVKGDSGITVLEAAGP